MASRVQILLLGSAALAAAFLLAVGASNAFTRHRLSALDETRWTDAEVDRLIADQRRLTALGVFPTELGTRDAGAALNRYVSLGGGAPEGEQRAESAAPWADLKDALKCRDDAPEGASWVSCAGEIPPMDLSFLATLDQYDTWDPASSGAWARYLRAHPREPAYLVAMPEFISWLNLAKVRLLQGLRGGDMPAALREVRQLARLTWTQETLVSAMIAVAMLNIERVAYEEAVEQGLLPADAWKPVSEADADALRKVAWGMVGLYSGDAPAGSLARLQAAVPQPLGQCSGINEGVFLQTLTRGLFSRTWPGEVDLSERLADLDAAVQSAPCRLTLARPAWEDPSRDLDVLTGGDPSVAASDGPQAAPDPPLLRHLARAPWTRQLIGLNLLEIAKPASNPYRG